MNAVIMELLADYHIQLSEGDLEPGPKEVAWDLFCRDKPHLTQDDKAWRTIVKVARAVRLTEMLGVCERIPCEDHLEDRISLRRYEIAAVCPVCLNVSQFSVDHGSSVYRKLQNPWNTRVKEWKVIRRTCHWCEQGRDHHILVHPEAVKVLIDAAMRRRNSARAFRMECLRGMTLATTSGKWKVEDDRWFEVTHQCFLNVYDWQKATVRKSDEKGDVYTCVCGSEMYYCNKRNDDCKECRARRRSGSTTARILLCGTRY